MTVDQALAASDCGRVCAVAGRGQREMRKWAAAYPRLYGAKAFDPALFSTLALAAAFSGSWLRDDELRMANRACLWCFGLDWLIDYAATSRPEVSAIVRSCLNVANANTPADGAVSDIALTGAVDADAGTELVHFLTAIRDELSVTPAFPALRTVWRDELERMLTAMAREWDWKTARAEGANGRPTFDEYLANADNLGFSFVFASHWISSQGREAEALTPAEITDIRRASWQAQRVIRLLNDLGTYERDLEWGDLNALALGVSRMDVEHLIGDLTGELRDLLRPIRGGHPRLAAYMERQVEFCVGFYGVTDYWGEL